MRLIATLIFAAFLLVVAPSATIGQVDGDVRLHLTDGKIMQVADAWEDAQGVWFTRGGVTQLMDRGRVKKIERGETSIVPKSDEAEPVAQAKETTTLLVPRQEHPIWIHLVGGARVQVDEVTEAADGVWFTLGKVSTFLDRTRIERIERGDNTKLTAASPGAPENYGTWRLSDSARVESFFMAKFGRRLPVTAAGQSGLHTRWRFDHRQSLDVGLHPDSSEGRALTEFLRGAGIPFLTFRRAVPGSATGPHIHIGRPSHRIGAR
jgi:hypothetical protein